MMRSSVVCVVLVALAVQSVCAGPALRSGPGTVGGKYGARVVGARELATVAAPTPITLGQAYYVDVAQGKWEYFSVTFGVKDKPVVEVNLIPWVGDPDLFLTLDGTTPGFASPFASFGMNSEYINILPTDPHYCSSASSTCTLTLGVYGFTNATGLFWVDTTDTVLSLYDGLPFDNLAFYNEYNQYRFYVTPSAQTIDFQVTTQDRKVPSTMLDIYCSYSPNPSKTNFNFASKLDSWAYSHITIDYPSRTGVDYYCAVFLPVNRAPVPYTFLATEGDPMIRLQEGQYQEGHGVAQTARTYFFDVLPDMKTLNISCSMGQGDSDLFVTADGTVPTHSNFQWRAQAIGDDYLVIDATDPTFQQYCTQRAGCDLHISVYNFVTSSYVIRVVETGDIPPPSNGFLSSSELKL